MYKQIIKDHHQFSFVRSDDFKWSPSTNTIHYQPVGTDQRVLWTLLHELGHALLGHTRYATDIELVKIERQAWDKALEVAAMYEIDIDPNHIEDCLDSYRDWSVKRATCPACATVSVQNQAAIYSCFNCLATWSVPSSPICRVMRIKTS